MDFEVQPVQVRRQDGSHAQGEFRIWEEHPDSSDVRLELKFDNYRLSADSEDYFEAMCTIRRQIEPSGYRLLCFGARKNVFPSGMSRSMGAAYKAYCLTMGMPGRIHDLVCIFDPDPTCEVATVDEQKTFYEEWMSSLDRSGDNA